MSNSENTETILGEIKLNKIRGMLMGAFLGDALGAPTEFRNSYNNLYTGLLEFETKILRRFQPPLILPVGRITDDSEMTLTLLKTIIKDKTYIKDHVIKSYMNWANSTSCIGKNTRLLLKGIKTIKGYEKRIQKYWEIPMNERSQSNGSLMRCSPLALLNEDKFIIQDCDITNPTEINRDCSFVYIKAIQLALSGKCKDEIFESTKKLAKTSEVLFVFDQVENSIERNIKEKKGWCLHGLWCALTAMLKFDNYKDSIDWVITSQRGSDSDTNACITGALLGSLYGFDELKKNKMTSKNIEIILSGNSELHDFYEFTQELIDIV